MKNFFRNKNTIKDVVLAVTYQCNARCSFCNIWKKKETYSLLSQDCKILPRSLKNVNISGGEPFLRKDLPELIKSISRQCPRAKIIISTNGFAPALIKQQMAKIIRFKKDISVAVSLDGFGKKHEDLRGFYGGFCLSLETLNSLKEMGIKDLKIAFTLGDQNIDQLKKVYRLSKEIGAEFTIAAYHNSSHYFSTQENEIRKIEAIKKELNWLIEQELASFFPKKWLRAYFAYGLIYFIEKKGRILPDYSGVKSLFIDPFGRLYPSSVWEVELGQLGNIKNWSDFSQRAKNKIKDYRRPSHWMICTAREAMRKHFFKVIIWILKRKIALFLKKQKKPFIDRKCLDSRASSSFLKRFISF